MYREIDRYRYVCTPRGRGTARISWGGAEHMHLYLYLYLYRVNPT